jgi:hypothetical protein
MTELLSIRGPDHHGHMAFQRTGNPMFQTQPAAAGGNNSSSCDVFTLTCGIGQGKSPAAACWSIF